MLEGNGLMTMMFLNATQKRFLVRPLLKFTEDSDGDELEGDGEEGPNGTNYFKVLVFYTNGELYTQSC